MSTREFYIEQLEAERPKFLEVIRALPDGKLDYKPHQKNASAGDIAWFLVLELRAVLSMLETGENHWEQPPKPDSGAAIATEYERVVNALIARLRETGDEEWKRECSMYYGGALMKRSPFAETAWDFLFDAIHHRGQLTAYLRPMGGSVPSVYGPSGDS